MQAMKTDSFTQGNIVKQMLLFSIPIMVGTLFQQLYNAVDVIVVGHYVGTTALACVGGSASMMINLAVGFFTGLSSGVTVIVARHFGAGDREQLNRSVHSSVLLAVWGGVFLGIAGILLTPAFLRLMHTPADTLEGSAVYLRIYFGGIIFVFLYNVGSAILRAMGDSKRPLHYLMICSAVNIILDVMLVVFGNLGVAGVAVATVISQAVSSFLILRALSKLPFNNPLRQKELRFHKEMTGSILKIGLPAGLQSIMNSLSGLVMAFAVNGLGTVAVAGNTAYAKLDGIYWMVSTAFSVTLATFVGQNYGAKQYQRMRKSIRISLGLDLAVSGFLCLFFFAASRYLLYFFTSDELVIEQALIVMRAIAPYYWIVPFYEILGSALRGVGDVTIPTVINIAGLCGVRALWIILFTRETDSIYDIIISCPVSWIVTAAAFLIYFAVRYPKQKALGDS